MATKAAAPKKETQAKADASKSATSDTGSKPGRKPGSMVNENDLFVVADTFDDEKKIAPQAKAIANIVKSAGKTGITRAALISAMDGVVQTRQPQGRILSYYQKKLIDEGYFTVEKHVPPAKDVPSEDTDAKTDTK